MSADVTPQVALDYYSAMLVHFGAEVRDKADDRRMVAAAWWLDALGVMDKKKFLENFTTTIHSTVFVNFRIADPADNLWDQMTLLAHELQHVHQAQQTGFIHYAGDYLLDPSSRAHYEAEAFRAEMEMDFWRLRRHRDPRALAEKLKSYACGSKEVDYVEQYLLASADTITAGGIISEASQVAITWLEQHHPELGWQS